MHAYNGAWEQVSIVYISTTHASVYRFRNVCITALAQHFVSLYFVKLLYDRQAHKPSQTISLAISHERGA